MLFRLLVEVRSCLIENMLLLPTTTASLCCFTDCADDCSLSVSKTTVSLTPPYSSSLDDEDEESIDSLTIFLAAAPL